MTKCTLLVGIDIYETAPPLNGCSDDAARLDAALRTHEDGSSNFECKLLTSVSEHVTRARLWQQAEASFSDFKGDVLFYCSGHGLEDNQRGYLVPYDGHQANLGVSMNEVLRLRQRRSTAAATQFLLF